MSDYNGLTESQDEALALTVSFIKKLHGNGVSADYTIYEAYKFCQHALTGDTAACALMDEAASLVGRTALMAGIHPDQLEARRNT